MMRSRSWRHGLLLVPLIFLGVFFFYPLISLLVLGFTPGGVPDLSSFVEMVSSGYYLRTFGFTLWQAALSTVLTILFALPGAYVFARYDFPGKNTLLALAILPFVLPTVVVAAAFKAFIGTQGLLNQALVAGGLFNTPPIDIERTLGIILIAHVFYNYPLALRMISSFWTNQSQRMEEAARTLGARRGQLWRHIYLPTLRPILLASAVLVFIFTFTSFGVIVILGGPAFATLEVEIFRQATSYFNLPMAGALSIVQLSSMFVMLALYTRVQRQIPADLTTAKRAASRPTRLTGKLLILFNVAFMATLLFLPLLSLVLRSFLSTDGAFTLNNYALLSSNTRASILFVPPIEAVGNSLLFAGMTMLIALLLGTITAFYLARGNRLSRWLDPLFMLPLAASAVTLGFGYIIALDSPPLNLRTSPWLVPISHTLVAMPFVVRSVLPAVKSIPPHIHETAAVLGAKPWQIIRQIDLPLISRGLAVGATFAFTVSMGEFGASVFVARPETPTMPVVIYRLLGQPGATNYGQALAMSSLLMLVCFVSFVLIERVRTAGMGEF